MLASVHDAEDALQETLLRAWRAIGRFEGRSSLRSWLYTIATNTSLNLIAKRPKRVLPSTTARGPTRTMGRGNPLLNRSGSSRTPMSASGSRRGSPGRMRSYELRESVELAFVAALQHLPANQRAVLILREVLGFSAAEVAETLDTTVASVNSALQRARKTVEEKTPDQSQQATLRSLGDERLTRDRRRLCRRVVARRRRDRRGDAHRGRDVRDAAARAAGSAPAREIKEFLARYPMTGTWRWRVVVTSANGGQPALGFYTWDEGEQAFLPFALNVLTFRGEQISDVVAFVTRSIEQTEREKYVRWPDEPADPASAVLGVRAVRPARPARGLIRPRPSASRRARLRAADTAAVSVSRS